MLVSMANLTFARKSVAYLYVTVSLLSFGVNPWLLSSDFVLGFVS